MRAALGIPRVDDLSTLSTDQLQRLEVYDREVRYRNALYQEQLAQEMQRRALAAAELEHLPGMSPGGLQQTYAGLLLKERLARGAEAEALAAHQQATALAAYRNQALYGAGHPLSAQAVAAARYEEDLRNQQQASALAQLRGAGVPGLEHLGLQSVGSSAGVASHTADLARQAAGESSNNDHDDPSTREDDQKMSATYESAKEGRARSDSRASATDSVEIEDMAIEQHKNKKNHGVGPSGAKKEPYSMKTNKRSKRTMKAPPGSSDGQPIVKKKRGRPRKMEGAAKAPYKKREKLASEVEERMRAEAILQAMADRAAGMRPQEIDASPYLTADTQQEIAQNMIAFPKSNKKGTFKAPDTSPLMGTIDGLLSAAETESRLFDGAETLAALRSGVEWPDSDEEPTTSTKKGLRRPPGLPVPKEPLRSIRTPRFVSHFPKLPEEPLDDFDDYVDAEVETIKQATATNGETKAAEEHRLKTKTSDKPSSKFPNILDFPYPVDSWFPTISSRKRERHQSGETSDEDNFIEDEPRAGEDRVPFRVNAKKIRARLEKEVEPGVLEKIPHCRIHRLKRKNSTLAELVYCCQVTECYPNEVMVCCSRCGTWRHAACGGHHEPYSVKKQSDEPFVAVCEQCHEEDKLFLNDNPTANQRIERQRMEQIRRCLATTAVMRSMSFSKHGGAYKWPLGSVSATHVGGHTRSVQSRHDKAEKQWADLITRLGRNAGSRTKERQRVRTKELERLLTAVEDAEGQTDRHNMLLFLMRDTEKLKPAGFEEEKKNMFDPSYSESEFDSNGYTSGRLQEGLKESNSEKRPRCLRENCDKDARFDSKFCCDGCGVSALETDLLHAFYESSDIHPSVLRSHY